MKIVRRPMREDATGPEYVRKVHDRLFLLHCHPEFLQLVLKELMFGYTLEFDRYGHPIAAHPQVSPEEDV